MYKQINSIYTNILDKRIFSCWLLYNTLIHMFTFPLSLLTDHQLVRTHLRTHFMAFHKSAINTTQHESRWHRVQFNEISMRATQDPLWHVMYEWRSMEMAAVEWMLVVYPSSWIKG